MAKSVKSSYNFDNINENQNYWLGGDGDDRNMYKSVQKEQNSLINNVYVMTTPERELRSLNPNLQFLSPSKNSNIKVIYLIK